MAIILDLPAGLTGTAEMVVGEQHTAPRVGSGRIRVLATPVMINLIEAAALAAVEQSLPEHHQSLGTHLDITGRKRAEEALRESEATLRSVFRAAPVGICFIRGRQVVSVNDALCRALGRSEGEMLGGNTRRSYFSDAEFEAVGRDLYGQIHRKGRGSVETRLRRKDGSEIQVILTGGMLQADNPSQGYVITVHDITDRKRAEGEREHTLSILRATLESTEDGILVVGKAGAVSGYNHRFLDIWGLSEERLSGMDDMKLLDYTKALVADPEAFRRQVMRYYDFPEEDGSGAIEMRDGRVLEWYSRPQRMGEAVVGRIWSFRDTTGRRRLEQQLLQAQKMEIVGRLAGGVAHDFNNILTVINGTADVVLLFASPDNPYYESFDEIRKAGERGANLTRQLLAFSRCQSVEPRVVSLNQILLDMNKMLRRLIGEHIELTTILDEGLLPVKVDPGHIEQVFTNLAVNARAAMPEGGKLTIETGNLEIGPESPDARPGLPPGKYVLFAVTDTGVGMEPEILPLIFKPFFTTKPRGKGTGLGLATCHGIVKQSGGDIEVESAPGRGTTFRVYLPAFEGETAELFASREASEIAAGTETVLVVEDDPMVSAVVSGLLESAGYRVLSASNGEDARSLMERTPETVHLLVTDVVMPLMGGNELAAHLTALRPGLKVLFMSGYTDYSILRENILEPGSRFIQKPFSSAAFLQKVRETLDG
jgi:PAS domain S-box-containing protein